MNPRKKSISEKEVVNEDFFSAAYSFVDSTMELIKSLVKFFRKKSASVVQSSNKSVGPVFEVKRVFLVWVILFTFSDHPIGGNLFSNLIFFALGAEEFSVHFEECED